MNSSVKSSTKKTKMNKKSNKTNTENSNEQSSSQETTALNQQILSESDVQSDETTVVNSETKVNKQRKKSLPFSIEEALKSKTINKFLIDHTKLEKNKNEPHYQLYTTVLLKLFNCQKNNLVDFTKTLSPFLVYTQNTPVEIFYDNSSYYNVLHELAPDFTNLTDVSVYIKLMYAFEKVINLNILNCLIYIEEKNLSKYKVFNIIEQVVFTQVLPSEINPVEYSCKVSIHSDIKLLKQSLVNKRKKGSGDISSTSSTDLQETTTDNNTSSNTDNSTTNNNTSSTV